MKNKYIEINIAKLDKKADYIMIVSRESGLNFQDVAEIGKLPCFKGHNIDGVLVEGNVNDVIKFVKLPKKK